MGLAVNDYGRQLYFRIIAFANRCCHDLIVSVANCVAEISLARSFCISRSYCLCSYMVLKYRPMQQPREYLREKFYVTSSVHCALAMISVSELTYLEHLHPVAVLARSYRSNGSGFFSQTNQRRSTKELNMSTLEEPNFGNYNNWKRHAWSRDA